MSVLSLFLTHEIVIINSYIKLNGIHYSLKIVTAFHQVSIKQKPVRENLMGFTPQNIKIYPKYQMCEGEN